MVVYPTILMLGPSRCGKDFALDYLERITPWKSAGTTSKYLKFEVARRKGLTPEEVYATRHRDKMEWFHIGNDLRDGDPCYLMREALKHGNMTGGIRDNREVYAAPKLFDFAIWIDADVPQDPTLQFSKADAIESFGRRLFFINNDKGPQYSLDLDRLTLELNNLFYSQFVNFR